MGVAEVARVEAAPPRRQRQSTQGYPRPPSRVELAEAEVVALPRPGPRRLGRPVSQRPRLRL